MELFSKQLRGACVCVLATDWWHRCGVHKGQYQTLIKKNVTPTFHIYTDLIYHKPQLSCGERTCFDPESLFSV